MDNKQIIITTSWDDGHALDLKLAEMLEKYNVKGTFYVPITNDEHAVMTDSELTQLAAKHEIGGHTVHHIYLNKLGNTDAKYEVTQCKGMLEDKIGKLVDAFCYPGGKYSDRDIVNVRDAGYLFGRTTKLLHSSLHMPNALMHTTVQAYNHSSIVLTKHCVKNAYFQPIIQNGMFLQSNKNFLKLVDLQMESMLKTGGVFHLWGHSWEIEEFGLWNQLEAVLKKIAFNDNVLYLNNTETWKVVNNISTNNCIL